jgi:hypothetical protein
MLPEQVNLLEKLMTWPTSALIEAEWQQRNEAVEAVRVYCNVLKGGPRQGRRPKATVLVEEDTVMEGVLTELAKPLSKQDQSFWLAEEHLKQAPEPSCCFQCFSNIG